MAARNAPEAGAFGITPQTFGSATADKFNRETKSQLEEIQKKLDAVTIPSPADDELPADAKLYALRHGVYGWPHTTGALSLTSGSPDLDVPGSGFGIGPLYKGERIELEFLLDLVTATGAVYVRIQLLGNAGQGSPEAVVADFQPFVQVVTARPVFFGGVFDLDRRIYSARIRIRLGSAGGNISVSANASMLQHLSVYAPLRSPAV